MKNDEGAARDGDDRVDRIPPSEVRNISIYPHPTLYPCNMQLLTHDPNPR